VRMIPKSGIRFSDKIMRHSKLARDPGAGPYSLC
jgi:hypothetical protein